MRSYWERQSFTSYDHIVVGSGIVGVSTAIELKEAFPKHSVLVLERGLLPTGATTRNAGFACMGGASELLADLEHQSEEAAVALFMRRKVGLGILRQRLNDAALGYRADGGYELIGTQDVSSMQQLDYLNKLLRPHLGRNAFVKQLLPDEDVVPGRGQVLITKPIPGLRFKGIFTTMRATTISASWMAGC